jgi:transglutaminase-like putative cysteine protease
MALNYPPLLIPLALAFWGWRSDTALAAGLLLAITGLARFSPWRWPLERSQYHRIGDLTSVLMLGAIGYFIIAHGDTPPVYALLRWLPVLFVPLLLAQLYSTADQLPLSVLFYSMRRHSGDRSPPTIDFRLPYALLCILAAGSGKADDIGYFFGATLLTFWALWRNRPRRRIAPAWLLLFALAAVLGYGGQIGLTRLQSVVEDWAMAWFSGGDGEPDPFRARTSIGDMGRLKLSGRVIMRIDADPGLIQPLLIKEAAYDRYLGQSWAAGKAAFAPFVPPNREGPRHLNVLRIESKPSVLVPVPAGLRSLILPPRAGELAANRLGAIKWLEAPPVLRYRIAYDPEDKEAAPPAPEVLEVPKATAAMLQPLVRQLGLEGLPPSRAVAVVADFFARNFTYSLYLGETQNSTAALQDFLYRRRSGHCEYFATATALLLRSAGVPARFVGGYSVEEYSPEEQTYLVRSRHAHAWAEAYVDGAWQAVDNTPSTWAEQDARTDPWWQTAADLWSRWTAAFRVWQWEQAQHPETEGFPLWGWLILPLALWLGWRLYRSRRRVPRRPPEAADNSVVPVDADYNRLEQSLVQAGHPPRKIGEPPLLWLRRIGRTDCEAEVIAYYRRRYRERCR